MLTNFRIRTGLAALLLALTGPLARASEFEAAVGKIGHGRCHMLTCGFFIIDDAVQVGAGTDGALFAFSVRSWANEYRDTERGDPYRLPPLKADKPNKSNVRFAYCSKLRPTLFDFYDGRWQSTSLRPGKSSAIFGATESAYMFYYAACHKFITEDAESKQMALKLGYRFALDPPSDDDSSFGDDHVEPFTMVK